MEVEGDIEYAVSNLLKAVTKADTKLDGITWKLKLFDNMCADDMEETHGEKVSVMEILESVAQAQDEYENLKRDIIEVQALERIARDSLNAKAAKAQQIESALRAKIARQHKQKPLQNQVTTQRLQRKTITKSSTQFKK